MSGIAPGSAARDLLSSLRTWWQRNNELRNFDSGGLDRIAEEFGMTGSDLKDLVARGPEAADLLHQRMRALGITRADVVRIASGLMGDFERTCSHCKEKGTCEWDLANRPDDAAWKGYCPNAISLESIKKTKGRFA